MHQPTDIGRELLRFGARQQHAVVEGVQETMLADPPFLLDQHLVHHRDLPGGSAERQRRDAQPDPEGHAERHGGGPFERNGARGLRGGGHYTRSFDRAGTCKVQLCVSPVASRHHRYSAS